MTPERWHAESCPGPDIVLSDDGRLPLCKGCERSPDLEALRAALPSNNSAIVPPKDELPGNLRLSWPPSVPYFSTRPPEQSVADDGSAATDGASSVELSADNDPISAPIPAPVGNGVALAAEPTNQPPRKPEESARQAPMPSFIYERRLLPNELRLLVLSTPASPAAPVHVELETYIDSERPDYETVSYTWGGEEGDSSLSKAVFVGPRWDVLFQTKNCEAMLRYLRPIKRGLRLVWVDAICINQADVLERESQVQKMRAIYNSAIRVVLYLGPDAVLDTGSGSFGRRTKKRMEELVIDFEKLGAGDALPLTSPTCPSRLREVLQRSYFGRIWVVQELLLARQIVMPLGSVDYTADQYTEGALATSGWSWESLVSAKLASAQWVRYMARGSPQGSSFSLYWMASQCRASDPRDKLFGILGLLLAGGLTPDYSLSVRHVSLGFLAHCILQEGDPGPLAAAGSFRNRTRDYTSWAFPINYAEAVGWERAESDIGEADVQDQVARLLQQLSHYVQETINNLNLHYTWPYSFKTKGRWGRTALSGGQTTAAPRSPSSVKSEWHRTGQVNQLTGALTLDLFRLCQILRKPDFIFHSDSPGGNLKLIGIWSSALAEAFDHPDTVLSVILPESTVVRPGLDHIFILGADLEVKHNQGGPAKPPRCFILRETQGGSDASTPGIFPRIFEMVTECHMVAIGGMVDTSRLLLNSKWAYEEPDKWGRTTAIRNLAGFEIDGHTHKIQII